MRERILLFLKAEQLTSTQFADAIGVQRSSVSHIMSGRNNPSYDFLRKILENYPGLNPEWLILGTGEMYKMGKEAGLFDNQEKEPETEPAGQYGQPIVEKRGKSGHLEEEKRTGRIQSAEIERVVIFYSDSTFTEYHPSG